MSADAPLLTVVVAAPGASDDELRATVRSVRTQTDGDWELVAVGDPGRLAGLLDAGDRSDPRVRVVPAGRTEPGDGTDRPDHHRTETADEPGGTDDRRTDAAARADALAAGLDAATGVWVAPLAPGEVLAPDALAVLRPALVADPAPVVAYGDAEVGTPAGTRRTWRPVWSPERLRGHQYIGGAPVLRTDAVRAAGGLRPELAGAEVHDLLLRLGETGQPVTHVPHVLSTTTDDATAPAAGPATAPATASPRSGPRRSPAVRAVQEHLDRLGTDAWVTEGTVPGTLRLVREPAPGTRVSVVIPTRGGHGLVWGQPRCFVAEAVASVLEHGGVDDVEIVVVYDVGTPAGVLEELRRLAGRRLVLVEFDGPFNFSAKCNLGFLAATGDVVVMLNDDVQVRSPRALARLVAPLREPDVGMTGARLLYSDGRVQHAGHLHAHGAMSHAFPAASLDGSRVPVELHVNRECSGLTAACVAMRRETYESVGGMWESLPVNFNDVDLCRKVLLQGLRLVWLADVELYHFESRTRVPVVHAWELDLVTGRWSIDGEDPYLPGHEDLLERSTRT